MNLVSNSFFHFTPEFECIKSILQNGFEKHYCKESIYLTADKCAYIGIPMLCFCDIPLSYLNNNGYGEFGIGMNKKWGWQKVQLQPVQYYPNNGNCLSTQVIKRASSLFLSDQGNIEDYRVLGVSKPYFKIEKKAVRKCNYLDREWRVVDRVETWVREGDEKFKLCEEEKGKKQRIGSRYTFKVADVDLLIVPEKYHGQLIDYIWDDLTISCGKELSEKERIILVSKIIKRETIIKNI